MRMSVRSFSILVIRVTLGSNWVGAGFDFGALACWRRITFLSLCIVWEMERGDRRAGLNSSKWSL